MDGMRLFDYARQGIPLPRPIEKRDCRVDELRLVGWNTSEEHCYKEPDREVEEEERHLVGKVVELAGTTETGAEEVKEDQVEKPTVETSSKGEEETNPSTFTVEMTVSSGTYVRSIVHDLAAACKSAAHVVLLTRTRQGEFSIPHTKGKQLLPSESSTEGDFKGVEKEVEVLPGNCIPWKVFADAIEEMKAEEERAKHDEEDEEEAAMNGGGRKTQMGFQKKENGEFVLKEWEELLLSR